MISDEASMIEFSGGRRPSIASDVTDLPEPDSPTSATVLSRGMSNEMPLTASKVVLRSRRNETRRLRTLISGSLIDGPAVLMNAPCSSNAYASLEFRIERIAQRVGEEREGGHQHGHRRSGSDQLPPLAENQLVLRLVQHRAPRHDIDRHAEAQERQDHLCLDEADRVDRHLHQHDVRDVRKDVDEHP